MEAGEVGLEPANGLAKRSLLLDEPAARHAAWLTRRPLGEAERPAHAFVDVEIKLRHIEQQPHFLVPFDEVGHGSIEPEEHRFGSGRGAWSSVLSDAIVMHVRRVS